MPRKQPIHGRHMAGLLAVLFLSACAHEPPPPPAPPIRAKKQSWPERVRLAVMPVESELYPAVAASVTDAMRHARILGVDDYFLSQVTLETAQIAVECVDVTPACLSAVGKSVSANQILSAQVSGKKQKGVQVTVTRFNVDVGSVFQRAEHVYANVEEAQQGAPDLIAQVCNVQPEPGESAAQ